MKKFFRKSILIFLIFIILLFSGCDSAKTNQPEPEIPTNNSVAISDEQLHFLQQLIAIIPPFQNIKEVDNSFWYDFIFNLYTHKSVNDGLVITDENKQDWIIVEKDAIDSITKQLFGITLPNYYPHENNLYREGTTFYILLTSPKEETDVLSTFEYVRNSRGEITFKNTETSKYCYFSLEKTDSEFGFVIESLMYTGDSPAINTKEEITTKKKETISEEHSFELESFQLDL